MQFILTIDTEGDNQWDHGRDLTVENIRYVPRFQELCERYGIKPTYLVTSEVCVDPFAQEIFTRYNAEGKAEIGAHLHSWTTPPFLNNPGFSKNDENHAFASEIPVDLLSKKICNLTEQISSSFGIRPTSFRSGRYGFNHDVARVLFTHNYLVDSSVTPFVSWSGQKGLPDGPGGPDFIDCPANPYRIDFYPGSIIEIPVTILPLKFPLNKWNKMTRYYFRHVNDSVFLRVLRKMFYSNQPVWFRPVPGTDINLLADLLSEAINKRLPFITMMFHSSELMPGCSKYRPDANSVEELYSLLDSLFSMLTLKGLKSATLTEAAKTQLT
jgi:hypothetical protein